MKTAGSTRRPASRRRGVGSRSKSPRPREKFISQDVENESSYYLYQKSTKDGAGIVKEDNWVDPDVFLKRMKVEKPGLEPFHRLVLTTLVVDQQVSLVVGVYISFLVHQELDREFFFREFNLLMLGYLMVATLVLSLIWGGQILPRAEQVGLCIILTTTFSPLLKTLTESYASNTVFTLAGMCAVLHLYLYNYQSIASMSTVSLNAGFLMCLLLASRLEHSEQVVSFLVSGIIMLVLVPGLIVSFRRRVYYSHWADFGLIVVNVAMYCCFAFTLWHRYEKHELASLYSAFLCLISVISPAILKLLHPCKKVILGPWDAVSVAPVHET